MKKIIIILSVVILISIFLYKTNRIDIVNNYSFKQNTSNKSEIVIKFQDNLGNKIKEDIILNGEIDQEYILEDYIIEGYTLKDVYGNKSGVFVGNSSTIVYIYTNSVPSTGVNQNKIVLSLMLMVLVIIIKKYN